MPRRIKIVGKILSETLLKPIITPQLPKKKTLLGADIAENVDATYYTEILGYQDEYLRLILAERSRKLKLLLKHFKINSSEETAYFELSLRLATEFVPGFKTKTKSSKGQNPEEELMNVKLYYTVLKLQAEEQAKNRTRRITRQEIIKKLIKTEPWKSKFKNEKTMKNRFAVGAKSPLVIMAKNIEDDPQTAKYAKDFKQVLEKFSLKK